MSFLRAFKKMGILWNKVIPYAALLVGFMGQKIKSEGKITLPVLVKEVAHVVEFLNVSTSSPYNCTMGRSSLNQF